MACLPGPLRAITRRVAQARTGDAGFSIVEVMVALAIFALVSVGAVAGAIAGTRASDSAKNRVTSVNVAQNDLDQARANPTPSPVSYTTVPASGGATYTVTRSVAPGPDDSCSAGGERRISVVVHAHGTDNDARLDTVIAC